MKTDTFQIEEKTILQNFNLNIEPGTTNAIIGPSGFGKTTLFNLLFSIYGPETGRVTIDGQDISGLDFNSFRKTISMVPQYGVLFNDTILYNLKYSNPDATMEEIIEVCKACEIHD
jgi:ATP-binding cassette subfamily B protein